MPIEIERKFLLASDAWRSAVTQSTRMRQGYVLATDERTVRVRVAGETAHITLKGMRNGIGRSEFEYSIPLDQANSMLDTLCTHPLIEKTRHLVPHAEHIWEIDVFSGENSGLIVAELELTHADAPFVRPLWLGREVSHDRLGV